MSYLGSLNCADDSAETPPAQGKPASSSSGIRTITRTEPDGKSSGTWARSRCWSSISPKSSIALKGATCVNYEPACSVKTTACCRGNTLVSRGGKGASCGCSFSQDSGSRDSDSFAWQRNSTLNFAIRVYFRISSNSTLYSAGNRNWMPCRNRSPEKLPSVFPVITERTR